MSRPKHHYVPKMLSRRFSGVDGLWFYDDNKPNRRVHTRSPDTIFFVRGLNTILMPDGNDRNEAEDLFASVESASRDILDQVIEIVRAGERPSLSRNARNYLCVFVFQMFKRPPEVRDERMNEGAVRLTLDGALTAFEQRVGRPTTDDEKALVASTSFMDRTIQNTRVITSVNVAESAMSRLAACGIYFLRAPPGRSFVIASNPTLRVGGSLGSPNAAAILPICSDVAVCLGEAAWESDVRALSDDGIRRFNERLWSQSHSLAGCARDLVLSLVRKRLRVHEKEIRQVEQDFRSRATQIPQS